MSYEYCTIFRVVNILPFALTCVSSFSFFLSLFFCHDPFYLTCDPLKDRDSQFEKHPYLRVYLLQQDTLYLAAAFAQKQRR